MTLRDGLVLASLALAAAAASADTLVLRNGRRVDGELVGYRDDRVEWRDERGRGERFERREVQRIEFGDFRSDTGISGSGRRSGMREREVVVSASEGWTRTGIELSAGERISFEARGEVRWGPNRKDGPDGERNSPHNAARPIPGRNAAALIGRIGNGDPFFIGGDRGEMRVRDSGPLYLGVNDDYLRDNSGSFRVTIYY
jgi:hypothetical protein